MNLGESALAIFVALDVFDQYFKELQRLGELPVYEERTNNAGEVLGRVWLDAPVFSMIGAWGERQTQLTLTGIFAGAAQTRDTGTPIEVRVLLRLTLIPRPGEAPILGFVFEGTDSDTFEGAIVAAQVQALMEGDLKQKLDDGQMNLVAPMVEILRDNATEEGAAAPSPDAFPVALRFLEGLGEGSVSALAITVGLPGEDPTYPEGPSPLPPRSEIAIVQTRRLLDPILAARAAEKVGTQSDGATIRSFSLQMGEDALLLRGHAEKDGADIDFDGPVQLRLVRGSSHIQVDTSDIDVDVDKPWYYYLGLVVGALLLFVPVIGGLVIDFFLTKGREAAGAPAALRRSLGAGLEAALAAMGGDGGGLGGGGLGGEGSVTLESTPSHLEIRQGDIYIFAQIFVSPITSGLKMAYYHKYARRFYAYELENGRLFSPEGLTRLMKSGKITVPGYHGVAGRYLRANPDSTEANNLLERFGRF